MKKRIFLSTPHMSGNEHAFIQEAFDTNWIAPLGPQVEAFERELASFVGATHALALSSGTAAIHLAMRYLGIGPGDVVLCSSFTFMATINPALYQGAEPVFVDSEPESWNMSPRALELALHTLKSEGRIPKAVVVVNLYGQSADYESISGICDAYGVPIIEDAAESLGATYKGRQTGTFGKLGAFSFNGNKIITTSGGGMLVSDDERAIAKCRFWATQAREQAPFYLHREYGHNYRLSNVLAGIGRAQLQVLPERVRRRREIFQFYKESLAGIRGVGFMPEPDFAHSNRWLTVMTLDPDVAPIGPLDLATELNKRNIETRPAWKPMHTQPIFAENRFFRHDGIDICNGLFERSICLPSGSNMTSAELAYVVGSIRSLLK